MGLLPSRQKGTSVTRPWTSFPLWILSFIRCQVKSQNTESLKTRAAREAHRTAPSKFKMGPQVSPIAVLCPVLFCLSVISLLLILLWVRAFPETKWYFFSLDSNIILIEEKTETEMVRKLQKRYRKCLWLPAERVMGLESDPSSSLSSSTGQLHASQWAASCSFYIPDFAFCVVLRCGFDHWIRKIPQRSKWQLNPIFLPGESPWTEEPGRLHRIT